MYVLCHRLAKCWTLVDAQWHVMAVLLIRYVTFLIVHLNKDMFMRSSILPFISLRDHSSVEKGWLNTSSSLFSRACPSIFSTSASFTTPFKFCLILFIINTKKHHRKLLSPFQLKLTPNSDIPKSTRIFFCVNLFLLLFLNSYRNNLIMCGIKFY